MGFKKLMIVAVAVMAALSFQACKKNKSDDKYTASPTIPGIRLKQRRSLMTSVILKSR